MVEVYDEMQYKEFISEIKHLNKLTLRRKEIVNFDSVELLQWVVKWQLIEAIPNLILALRLYLTVYVSVASYEWSFSKLKLIRTYLLSTMSHFCHRERVGNGD